MNYVNTHKPTNRTFAVIDGRLYLKASVEPLITTQKPRLLDQVRQAIRTRHYNYKTEKAYVHWIKRYIFFHDKRHPAEMAEKEIARFLSSLATEGHVSASTQNQAFNALLFLYHEVLDKKIGLIDGVVRAKRPERLPVVLTKDEVKKSDRSHNRRPAFDGDSALWCRLTIAGMLPASSQGHRFFSQRDCCSIKNRLGIPSTMAHPSYANLKKPSPDEIVIRYTSLAQFIWIMTQQKLPLIRVDLFRDPYEGSAPDSVIEQQMVVSGGRNSMIQQMAVLRHHYPDDSWPLSGPLETSSDRSAYISACRRNRTYSTHASCWRWGPESEGMWRIYCGEKGGVALQTTFARLEQSVESEQVLAGKIQYVDYDVVPPYKEELDHVMHKRNGFAFEQEVRLLKADQESLQQAMWRLRAGKTSSLSSTLGT